MKKFLVLGVLALAISVAVYRQRIFLWDPLARVERDGVKQVGVRVMINYSNDVLVDDKSRDQDKHRRRLYLVQHWNQVAEYSTGPLKCIEFMACMTDADHAGGEQVTPRTPVGGAGVTGVTMTNKQVEFVDEDGARVTVALR